MSAPVAPLSPFAGGAPRNRLTIKTSAQGTGHCPSLLISLPSLRLDPIRASQSTGSPAQSSSWAAAAASSSSTPTATASSPAARASTAPPTPAERMTENTIFDMASAFEVPLHFHLHHAALRSRASSTSDEPVEQILPAFNPDHDTRASRGHRAHAAHAHLPAGRRRRVNLKDPWGLAKPDKAEGIQPRAQYATAIRAPEAVFRYFRHQLHPARRRRRDTLRRAARRLCAGAHLQAAQHRIDTAQYCRIDKACGPRKNHRQPPSRGLPPRHGHAHYACPCRRLEHLPAPAHRSHHT